MYIFIPAHTSRFHRVGKSEDMAVANYYAVPLEKERFRRDAPPVDKDKCAHNLAGALASVFVLLY
jgi:hypothetical protein